MSDHYPSGVTGSETHFNPPENIARIVKVDDVLGKSGPVTIRGVTLDTDATCWFRRDNENAAIELTSTEFKSVWLIVGEHRFNVTYDIEFKKHLEGDFIRAIEETATAKALTIPDHKWEEMEEFE